MVLKTRHSWPLVAAAILGSLSAATAGTPISTSGYTLPLALAVEAASEAVRVCESNNYAVTATVVDVSGTPKAILRGDHSTIHTKDSAYRKAYTAVTMGPIFGFDRTSAFVELVAKYPGDAGISLSSLPDITALPGGVAIKAGDEIVAAIGVGGSPGGDKDEACAQAGVAKIKDKLPK
jgi:uncharacterized protein GlcG (DUF336 family)